MKTNKKFEGITTFGIDCDEVLRSLLDGMVSLYNENFNENLDREDVKDFNVEISFPRIKEETGTTASEWFFQKHGNELFAKSPALPKIKESIDTLRQFGHVFIITYQKSLQNKLDTLNWLSDNGIEYDGICFVKNKTILHLDVLVDDNPWNFIGCNATEGALITAPYNKDEDLEEIRAQSNCLSIKRYDSLEHFVRIYSVKAKLKNIKRD